MGGLRYSSQPFPVGPGFRLPSSYLLAHQYSMSPVPRPSLIALFASRDRASNHLQVHGLNLLATASASTGNENESVPGSVGICTAVQWLSGVQKPRCRLKRAVGRSSGENVACSVPVHLKNPTAVRPLSCRTGNAMHVSAIIRHFGSPPPLCVAGPGLDRLL